MFRFASLKLEPLNDRILPAGMIHTWDGGGADLNASTAENWDTNMVPQDGDILLFDEETSGGNSATIDAFFTSNIEEITLAMGYSGTVTVENQLNVASRLVQQAGTITIGAGSDITGRTFGLDGGTINGAGTINVTNLGSMTVGADASVKDVTINVNGGSGIQLGIGSGLNSVTVQLDGTGLFEDGISLQSVTLTTSQQATLTLNGSAEITSSTFHLDGTTDWLAGILFSTNSTYNNSGTFRAHQDGTFTGATGEFTNIGTVLKMAGSGVSTFDISFHNSGLVRSSSGSLLLGRGGSQTGEFKADGGSTEVRLFAFAGNPHTFNTGAQLTGTGMVHLITRARKMLTLHNAAAYCTQGCSK